MPFSAPSDPLAHVQENFVRHILPLKGFVLTLVPQRHMADDIVQETFLTACDKAASYEPGTNFRAWIFTIARFKVLALIKRESGRGQLLSTEATALLLNESLESAALDLPERVAALDGCMGKLARTARQAVELRYTENLGPTEIASRMGWSVNALNVALSRARIFLRRCVEQSLNPGRTC
jgi:RNA polymerase sigma-70 factor (ECF subfamily)